MACRLPGGIDSPELLWEALLRGDDLITEIPAERWDVDEHYDPERGVTGRSVSRWGAFLDEIAGFDPEHRLLLETGYSTRFPTSERSHYARVIASSNEYCSDTRSRGCEGGVAKTMEALTDALVAPIFLAPPAPTSRGIFSAWCRRDRPHRRRARGGPECR
jgi:Beta-ketoacyl synthase, N-terminal domain